MRQAGISVSKEPRFILGSNNKSKPADTLANDFRDNTPLAVDTTVVNPCCPTYVANAATTIGYAAKLKDTNKSKKYLENCKKVGLSFQAFAVETYGTFSPSAMNIINTIVKKTCMRDPEAAEEAFRVQKTYLLQKISVTLQCANANLIRSCSEREYSHLSDPIDLFSPIVNVRDLIPVDTV